MFIYDIKTSEEVKKLNGGDLQDLATAIENDTENHFTDAVKVMCKQKQELIGKYGIYADLHLNELKDRV